MSEAFIIKATIDPATDVWTISSNEVDGCNFRAVSLRSAIESIWRRAPHQTMLYPVHLVIGELIFNLGDRAYLGNANWTGDASLSSELVN